MKTWLSIMLLMLLITQAMVHKVEEQRNTTNTVDNCNQECKDKISKDLEIWTIVFYSISGVGLLIGAVAYGYATYQDCQEQEKPYRQLKKQYCDVQNESMPREEFVSKRDLVIEALRKSKSEDNYCLYGYTKRYQVHVSQVKILKQEKPLLTSIELKGEDHETKWTARGYILSRNNQIFMWFTKQYVEWSKVMHPYPKELRIYQSTEFGQGALMQGKWFYRNHEGQLFYHGIWTLEQSRLNDKIMSEQILTSSAATLM